MTVPTSSRVSECPSIITLELSFTGMAAITITTGVVTRGITPTTRTIGIGITLTIEPILVSTGRQSGGTPTRSTIASIRKDERCLRAMPVTRGQWDADPKANMIRVWDRATAGVSMVAVGVKANNRRAGSIFFADNNVDAGDSRLDTLHGNLHPSGARGIEEEVEEVG